MTFHFLDASFSSSPKTLACENRDYAEWHRGRERYCVWVLEVESGPVLHRWARARAHLRDWLTVSRRQAHITLYVNGFITEQAHLEDDFSPAMLMAQQRALAALPAMPFTLRIGALDSFDSAVFLQVLDPDGGLLALREALAQGSREIRQSVYIPHLTVGLYNRSLDKQIVSQRLQAFSDTLPLVLPVRRIGLVSYAARELGGLLQILYWHDLVSIGADTRVRTMGAP